MKIDHIKQIFLGQWTEQEKRLAATSRSNYGVLDEMRQSTDADNNYFNKSEVVWESENDSNVVLSE